MKLRVVLAVVLACAPFPMIAQDRSPGFSGICLFHGADRPVFVRCAQTATPVSHGIWVRYVDGNPQPDSNYDGPELPTIPRCVLLANLEYRCLFGPVSK